MDFSSVSGKQNLLLLQPCGYLRWASVVGLWTPCQFSRCGSGCDIGSFSGSGACMPLLQAMARRARDLNRSNQHSITVSPERRQTPLHCMCTVHSYRSKPVPCRAVEGGIVDRYPARAARLQGVKPAVSREARPQDHGHRLSPTADRQPNLVHVHSRDWSTCGWGPVPVPSAVRPATGADKAVPTLPAGTGQGELAFGTGRG